MSDYRDSVMSLGNALKRIKELEHQQSTAMTIIESLQADTERFDFLENLVTEACITSCFELDGGIHLTIDRPSKDPEVYRECNNLREAIDKAMKS